MEDKEIKPASGENAELENDELQPYAVVVEEEYVTIESVDPDDLSDMDMQDEGEDNNSSDACAGNDISAASIDDFATSYMEGNDMEGNDQDNKEEKDDKEEKDEKDKEKKKTNDLSGDGDKIEEIDDEVVAQTNELLKEKREEKNSANENCECGN